MVRRFCAKKVTIKKLDRQTALRERRKDTSARYFPIEESLLFPIPVLPLFCIFVLYHTRPDPLAQGEKRTRVPFLSIRQIPRAAGRIFCDIFGRMEYVVKEREYSEYNRQHKGAGKDAQRWKEG